MSFSVVRNAEDQYSIWPGDAPPPNGWEATGFSGTEAECLDHIATVWRDIRPVSAREGGSAAPEEDALRPLFWERLVLRPISREHAERLVAQRPREGERWLEGYPDEGSVQAARFVLRALERGPLPAPAGIFEIVRTADGTAIGGIGVLEPPADGAVEIGFGLAPAAQGEGFATEAVQCLTSWLLRWPEVERVLAHTDPDNTASQRVLARAGFQAVDSDGDRLAFVHRAPSPGARRRSRS